jgi:hypothetical protein
MQWHPVTRCDAQHLARQFCNPEAIQLRHGCLLTSDVLNLHLAERTANQFESSIVWILEVIKMPPCSRISTPAARSRSRNCSQRIGSTLMATWCRASEHLLI